MKTTPDSTAARRLTILLSAFVLTLLSSIIWGTQAQASATDAIVVNSFGGEVADDGLCTLREAVIAANQDKAFKGCPAGDDADTILLPPGVYLLVGDVVAAADHASADDLDITQDLTIQPTEAGLVVIDAGAGAFRVFEIEEDADVTIRNVTLRNGRARSGAGIYVHEDADLTLVNVTLTTNFAVDRGGALLVEDDADVRLVNVTIVGNDAPAGGAIKNYGEVHMVNSIVGANGDDDSPACSGAAPQGSGPNLVADVSCATSGSTVATDLGLTALTDGSGVTLWTITELSPAFNTGVASACPSTDQVGTPRPQLGQCDLGAHELVQSAPTAGDVTATTTEDTPVTVTLAGADPNGDTLAFLIAAQPAAGSLGTVTQLSANTAATVYTPTTDFSGVVTFTYAVSDGVTLSAAAVVTVTVSPENDSPLAANDTLSTDEDTPADLNVVANDGDVDGDLVPNSVSVIAQPGQGSAVAKGNGLVTYTPPANWHGMTSFQYSVCDNALACATASVTVFVTATADAPIAANDALTVTEDFSGTVSVVANDVDVDGNLDPDSVSVIFPPGNGSVVVNDGGTIFYAPPKHWSGATSFQYQVCDTTLLCAAATVEVTVQPDEFLEVTTTADAGPGSLRDAIDQANVDPDLSQIVFDIPGAGPHVILLDSALPAVQYPVVIDATTQPVGQVILDGQDGDFPGLMLLGGGGSTIQGLEITNFGGSAIVLQQSGGNALVGNTLTGNGGDGVTILGDPNDPTGTGGNQIAGNVISGNAGNGITIVDSVENDLSGNEITGNGGLSVDLGGDGRTPNDPGDPDDGANFTQNYPVIFRAAPGATGDNVAAAATTQIEGWLNSKPNQTFAIRVYAGELCNAGDQQLVPTTPATVTTGDDGNVYFSLTASVPLNLNQVLQVTATDGDGNTSEYSDCIVVAYPNDAWPSALPLEVRGQPAVVQQYIDQFGQARWFRFAIQPHSQVEILLTNLPANYDVTLYKDLATSYQELLQPRDLNELSAEFAPSAFSPSAFSPSAFSPSAFSPSAFSPSAFSPSAFSPSAFSPSAFSPSAFSPSAFSPSAFSPSAFSPSAFSPSAFSPSAFSPSAFSPSAFSNAQTRSLIGVSAFDGVASEGLVINSWNNTGEFYVRVRGSEGAFSLDGPFRLQVTVAPGPCADLPADSALPATSLTPATGGFKSIILVDEVRLRTRYASADVDALLAQLAVLAARPEVQGVVVDISDDARVAAANAQGDTFASCPYAKNLVAESIRSVIGAYQVVNPLEYVVLVGNDDVIPFFRYPDNALLGHESNYVPPVKDESASQASLRLGYVLSQDAYGASVDLSLNATRFPLPDLAVGRLVEEPGDMMTMLGAYLSTVGGVAPAPSAAFVTGYDFLEDAALAVQGELAAGLNRAVDALITPQELSPLDPASWTAAQLRDTLASQRYDIVYLAGHFNSASALAADYRTSFLSTELLALPVDLSNALYFSAGCHSGYNVVNSHGVPGVTFEPDWAQAFARRGATLVAGTGYQYGDTQFLEYSERLYLEFARKLRTGDGPVPVGKALVAAKQRYLATTPFLRGIHEKALLEATLFGLPMFAVDMPGARLPAEDNASVVGETQSVGSVPGNAFGLRTADLTVTPQLAERVLALTNVDDGATVEARWLEGSDGVVTNPAEPALPLESVNVHAPGLVLRGVGLRGGSYQDTADILPLTGAPTTELRGVHSPFQSSVWFPLRPWGVNYFGALTGDDVIRLNVTPAQHRSESVGDLVSRRRQYSRMDFRLFYTPNTGEIASSAEGQGNVADAPTIAQVLGLYDAGEIGFRVRVVGNPAAGIQNVWVTYTALQGPWLGTWQSLDLVQNPDDSTLWQGSLPLQGTPLEAVRFIAQAANGAGLVALAENLGRYYTPGGNSNLIPTQLAIEPLATTSAAFGSTATFAAVLLDGSGNPLANQPLTFGVGSQDRLALTDAGGRAEASIPLLGTPGLYLVNVTFGGNGQFAASARTSATFFTIRRQAVNLLLNPASARANIGDSAPMTATLVDAGGRRLVEQTVFFEVTGQGRTLIRPVITNLVGEAALDGVILPGGSYAVVVRFDGTASHESATSQDGELLLVTAPTNEDEIDQPLRSRIFLPNLQAP